MPAVQYSEDPALPGQETRHLCNSPGVVMTEEMARDNAVVSQNTRADNMMSKKQKEIVYRKLGSTGRW